jgi:hypothetical protein
MWGTLISALLNSPTVTHESGSPQRMKIAGLFSAESLMRVGLTTTHENDYFQRSIGSFSETPPSLREQNPSSAILILGCSSQRLVSASSGSGSEARADAESSRLHTLVRHFIDHSEGVTHRIFFAASISSAAPCSSRIFRCLSASLCNWRTFGSPGTYLVFTQASHSA